MGPDLPAGFNSLNYSVELFKVHLCFILLKLTEYSFISLLSSRYTNERPIAQLDMQRCLPTFKG